MKKDKVTFAMTPVSAVQVGKKRGKSKAVAIVLSITAAVLVVVAGGIFLWNAGIFSLPGLPKKEPEPTKPFTFAADTKVSGLDISGKTVSQARMFLKLNESAFVPPKTIAVQIAGSETSLTQEDFDYTYNIDEVVEQVVADAENKLSTAECTYTVEAKVTDLSVKQAAEKVCEEYNAEPVNARVSAFHPFANDRFEIEDAQDGLTVDAENLKTQLAAAFASEQPEVTIEAQTQNVPATVTAEYIKKNLVKLSSYETTSSNTDDATNNMKISMEACSGSIIEPGEIWSFNDCTGDSNLESNGYKSANVISEGKVTQGIGGGICQSSSTIYNAAILANMGIYERYPHKWASYYVPTGLDATIDYPNLDLKLENTSDFQMFLECKVTGYTLHATFWGFRNGDYDEIRTRNEQGKTGDKSYSVRAWRMYYKDGKKISEEELDSSDYDLENGVNFTSAENDDHVVYAGPGPLPADAAPSTKATEATS